MVLHFVFCWWLLAIVLSHESRFLFGFVDCSSVVEVDDCCEDTEDDCHDRYYDSVGSLGAACKLEAEATVDDGENHDGNPEKSVDLAHDGGIS